MRMTMLQISVLVLMVMRVSVLVFVFHTASYCSIALDPEGGTQAE